MSTPSLMSERDDPFAGGKWKDCTYAAHMMAAYKTGFRAFPLGYTRDEREALERADDRPDETGGNVIVLETAMSRRYGFKLVAVPNRDLEAALRGPASRGFAIAGLMSKVSTFLRRWDPPFTGAHDTYVEPVGDSKHVLWLDPLAKWGFKGDIIPVETVLTFNAPFGVGNVRMAVEGSQRGYRLTVAKYAQPKSWKVTKGTMLYGYDPDYPGGPVRTASFSADSSASADAEVTVSWPGNQSPPVPVPHGGPFLRVTTGIFEGLLIVKARVTVL